MKATAPIEKIPPGVNRKDYVFEWTGRTFPHHISKQLEWNVFRAAEFDLRYQDHTSFTLSSELVHDFEISIPGALKLKFTEASQRLEVCNSAIRLCRNVLLKHVQGTGPNQYFARSFHILTHFLMRCNEAQAASDPFGEASYSASRLGRAFDEIMKRSVRNHTYQAHESTVVNALYSINPSLFWLDYPPASDEAVKAAKELD